jgi:hypothetical protein
MGRRLSWTRLFGVILVGSGCATSGTPATSGPIVSRRLAALPADGVVGDCQSDAPHAPMIVNPRATVIAEKTFDDSVNYRVSQHGGRAFRAAAIDGLPHAYPFHLWVHSTLREIMRYGSASDLKFSSSLGAWRTVLDADFILVSLFSDNHSSLGLGCGETPAYLGGGLVGELVVQLASLPLEKRESGASANWSLPQGEIACVIHLETSRIVWCKGRRLNDDLSVRFAVQTGVDSLLNEMLVAGDGAPLEPPPAGPPLARATPVEDPGPAVDNNKPKLHAP